MIWGSVEFFHDFAGEMSPWLCAEASGFSQGGIHPDRSLATVEGLFYLRGLPVTAGAGK